MLAIIGIILLIAWIAGLAFHVLGGFIHIALVLGAIFLIWHFVTGGKATT